MSDAPEKISLTNALASILLENRQVIGQALVRATQRAVVAHQAQQLQQNHRADIVQRQVVELFTRLARQPTATSDPPHAARAAPGSEDAEVHAELDTLAAERARIQQEKRLLRARQARAREEMELEELRRETEAMEAHLRDLRAGKEPAADAGARMGATPAAEVEEQDERAPTSDTQAPRSSEGHAPSADEAADADAEREAYIYRTARTGGEHFKAAQAALEERDCPKAIRHAESALAALQEFAEMAPEHAVGLLPTRAAVLSVAARAHLEIGEIIRGLDLLDDWIDTARAATEQDPNPGTIFDHIQALLHKGDIQLQLGRIHEATDIYQDALTRLRRLADHAPSEHVLNETVLVGRKLDRLASMHHTH